MCERHQRASEFAQRMKPVCACVFCGCMVVLFCLCPSVLCASRVFRCAFLCGCVWCRLAPTRYDVFRGRQDTHVRLDASCFILLKSDSLRRSQMSHAAIFSSFGSVVPLAVCDMCCLASSVCRYLITVPPSLSPPVPNPSSHAGTQRKTDATKVAPRPSSPAGRHRRYPTRPSP